MIVATTTNVQFIANLDHNKYQDTRQTNEQISKVINTQSLVVFRWFVIASVITLLLLLIKRYRSHEKTLLIDSATILIFCMLSVVYSQIILRAFISNL